MYTAYNIQHKLSPTSAHIGISEVPMLNQLPALPAPCGCHVKSLLGVVCWVGVHPTKHSWERGHEAVVGGLAGGQDENWGNADCDDRYKQLWLSFHCTLLGGQSLEWSWHWEFGKRGRPCAVITCLKLLQLYLSTLDIDSTARLNSGCNSWRDQLLSYCSNLVDVSTKN